MVLPILMHTALRWQASMSLASSSNRGITVIWGWDFHLLPSIVPSFPNFGFQGGRGRYVQFFLGGGGVLRSSWLLIAHLTKHNRF
jgi:hypothetical protein